MSANLMSLARSGGKFLKLFGDRKMMKTIPTARDYVQDGLIAMWDGIENAGWGIHSSDMILNDLLGGGAHIDFVNTSRGDCSILFDGRDEQAGMLNEYQYINSQVLTIEFCVSLNSTKNQCFIQLSGSGNRYTLVAGVYNKSRELFTGPNFSPIYNISELKIGTVSIQYIVGSFQSTKAYNNGVELSHIRDEGFSTNNGLHYVGNRQNNTSFAMSGEFFSMRWYSRYLTDAEISHNNEIDKARFNLS